MRHIKQLRHVALIVALLGMFALSASAAAPTVIDGTVESVNKAEKSFVVKDKKTGESMTIKDPSGKVPIHIYTKGTKDDAKEGETLKVYGKVQPDLSSVDEVFSVCIMPVPSTVSNKKSRVDGKLVVEDGKWFLDRSGKRTAVTLKDKVDYQKVFEVDYGFLEVGMHMRAYGDLKDDYYAPKWDIRGYTAREKVEKYVAGMTK